MTRAFLPNPSAPTEWLFAGFLDRAVHHWEHAHLFDGGIGQHDHADSDADTVIPDYDDDIASFASQPFASVQPSSLCYLALFLRDSLLPLCNDFPGDLVSQHVSRVPASLGDLELIKIFDDHGVLADHRKVGAGFLRNRFSQQCKGRQCVFFFLRSAPNVNVVRFSDTRGYTAGVTTTRSWNTQKPAALPKPRGSTTHAFTPWCAVETRRPWQYHGTHVAHCFAMQTG